MIQEVHMKSVAKGSDLSQLVLTSLMICLILLGTIMFRIPVPMTQGYVHLGDAMIYLAVLLLGRRNGAAASALGSAMGDILGGFAFWAPWTLAIKFLMAYVTATLIRRIESAPKQPVTSSKMGINVKIASAMTAGGLVMCVGYLIAERIMYGSWALAAISLPWNIGQFAVGIAVTSVVYPLLAGHTVKN